MLCFTPLFLLLLLSDIYDRQTINYVQIMHTENKYSTQFVQCQYMDAHKVELGKKLKELRIGCSLTQEELAKKIGISRVNYTRYERDTVRPDYGSSRSPIFTTSV